MSDQTNPNATATIQDQAKAAAGIAAGHGQYVQGAAESVSRLEHCERFE